jgi:hypothetical protein
LFPEAFPLATGTAEKIPHKVGALLLQSAFGLRTVVSKIRRSAALFNRELVDRISCQRADFPQLLISVAGDQ